MYDVERIKYQVTNGKNAMPAFGERLGPDDIEDVANYVIDQANKGWCLDIERNSFVFIVN